MEINNSVVNNESNLVLEQKIHKLGKFSRITGYLYLILTIVPITAISLTGFLLKAKSTNNATPIIRENVINNFDYDNGLNDFLEPFIPVFIFGFISFIILNIFLIYISNKIIKNDPNQTDKYLSTILTISILILIIFAPLLISLLSPLSFLDIKIIADASEIKRLIKNKNIASV